MSLVYNKLSEEFKKKVRWGIPPGRDEVVTFELCYIPKIKQNGELKPVYRNHRIPNTDTIYDPKTNEYVQIASVQRETGNKEEPYILDEIMFLRGSDGTMSFSGKEPSKFDMLYFLRASNYNESNPLAVQPGQGYLFRELAPEKTASDKVKERREKAECEQHVLEMKDADLAAILTALRLPVMGSLAENQEALLAFVEKKGNRDKFLALSTDVRTPIAALINKAEEQEKIRFDDNAKAWTFVATKKLILQVPPQSDNHEALINYFHNDKHGKAFKEFLEKEIDVDHANEALVDAATELEKTNPEVVKKPRGFQKKESV